MENGIKLFIENCQEQLNDLLKMLPKLIAATESKISEQPDHADLGDNDQ